MNPESTARQITHPITADRDYYIARVGRCLEVRCRQTHAVLQVFEPPREWGNSWLWSSCGFDGTSCVALDFIRFVRTDLPAVSGGAFGQRVTRRAPPPQYPPRTGSERAGRDDVDHLPPRMPTFRPAIIPGREEPRRPLGYRDEARSSSRIQAGVSLM